MVVDIAAELVSGGVREPKIAEIRGNILQKAEQTSKLPAKIQAVQPARAISAGVQNEPAGAFSRAPVFPLPKIH